MESKRGRQMLYRKTIAIFMLVLMLSLPIISAASLSTRVYGKYNLTDLVSADDVVVVEAIVTDTTELNGAAGVTERLAYGSDMSNRKIKAFDNCTQTASGEYTCTYTSAHSFDSSATLYKDLVTLYDTKSKSNLHIAAEDWTSYYVDSAEPIVALSLKQFGDEVKITYALNDTLSQSFVRQCSGFNSITATKEGVEVGVVNITQPTDCAQSGDLRVPLAVTDTGLTQFCMVGVDRVGQVGQACETILIDQDAPDITELFVADANDVELSYIADTGAVSARLFARVTGDFENDEVLFTYEGTPFAGQCGATICRSDFFPIPSSLVANITLLVTDESGNEDYVAKSQTIAIDTTAPILTDISSTHIGESILFLSTAANITATFTEAESGFSISRPLLKIASQSKPAQSCDNTGGTWVCSWPASFYTISDGDYNVTISGEDDAQNTIDSNFSQEIRVDTLPPTVAITQLYAQSTFTEQSDVFVAGGKAIINFTFVDVGPIYYRADFTAIGGGALLGRCDLTQNCTKESTVLSPGGVTGAVTLVVSDLAGNLANVTSDSVSILRDATGSEEDFFTHSLRLAPSKIETSTSDYLNHRSYATIKARLHDNFEGEVTDISVMNCQNAQGANLDSAFERANASNGGIGYIQGYEQIDLGARDEAAILFTFKATAIRDDNISFDCSVRISGIAGDAFVSNEIETVKILFETYEMQLGSLPENYQDEVDAAIEDALEGTLASIASFMELYDYAVKLCQLLGLYKTIKNVISILSVNLSLIGIATTATGGQVIGELGAYNFCTGEAINKGTDQIINTVGAICQWVTCELTLWDLGKLFKGKGGYGQASAAQVAAANGGSTGSTTATASTSTGSNSADSRPSYEQNGPLGNSLTNRQYGKLNATALWGNSAENKDNLILSVLNLCIPGVLENLDKQRQIKCQYALCLVRDVPAGTPKQACDEAQEYALCVYVYGQLLGLLPIHFFNTIISQVMAFFTSPMALINGILSINCIMACKHPATATFGPACYAANLLKQLGELYGQINNIITSWDSDAGPIDYCESLEDEVKAQKKAARGSS